MLPISNVAIAPPEPSGTTEVICTERSVGPVATGGVGVVGITGVTGVVEVVVAGCMTIGGVVRGLTMTVAFPCTCFEEVALGMKTMERGTVVEAVPESCGVSVSALLVVGILNAAPHGIVVVAPPTTDWKWATSLH